MKYSELVSFIEKEVDEIITKDKQKPVSFNINFKHETPKKKPKVMSEEDFESIMFQKLDEARLRRRIKRMLNEDLNDEERTKIHKQITDFGNIFSQNTTPEQDEIINNIMQSVSPDHFSKENHEKYGSVNKWMDERRNSWVEIRFMPEKARFNIQKAFEKEELDNEYGIDLAVPMIIEDAPKVTEKLKKLFDYLTAQRLQDISKFKKK